MDREQIGYWLVIVTFIIALIFFLWYALGKSPTIEQTLIAFIATYTALFIYLDGKITRSERELTNKLEDVERRLSDKISGIRNS